jgi:hypothetical protein
VTLSAPSQAIPAAFTRPASPASEPIAESIPNPEPEPEPPQPPPDPDPFPIDEPEPGPAVS